MSGTVSSGQREELARHALEIRSFAIADARFERGQRWIGPSGHMLELTHEGDLELRNPSGEKLWNARTSAANAAALILKTNGDLVIVDWRGYPLWSTATAGNEGAFLALQRDGNLVLYSAALAPLWETGTAGG